MLKEMRAWGALPAEERAAILSVLEDLALVAISGNHSSYRAAIELLEAVGNVDDMLEPSLGMVQRITKKEGGE